jgi:hypothetical protein
MQSTNGSPIDDYRSFYQRLHHTGIDYYFKKDRQGLQSDRPMVCAACLVILENDPHYLSASQRTLLDGMLKVLDLGKDDYCVAWMMQRAETGPYSRESSILKYAPYSVLLLGSALEKIKMDTIFIAHTYSPSELEIDPKRKRSAFDTLLDLKKQLTTMNASL